MADPKRVEASPEKRFFISMLTKDIELLPAIVDLVDNSVDGARTLQPNGEFAGLFVRLSVGPKEFRIVDNCGGIEAAVARQYAFRFGRPAGFKGVDASVGQFGVGMKRALFKLGDYFQIVSVAAKSKFALTVDVPKWAKDTAPDWSFEFDSVDDNVRSKRAERGTDILVKSLHPQVGTDFGANETIGRLRLQLSLQHQSALAGGLTIEVNGTRLTPSIPRLLLSKRIKPINYTFDIPVNGAHVGVRIVAGIAARKGGENKDEGRAEDFTEPSEAGWYVFCNERLVVAADKSAMTGWGRVVATYHPQYRRFRGYAFLQARDSSLLPLNTTKTSLDQDSPVFRSTQQAMFTALSSVAAAINRQKAEIQQRPEDDRPLTAALDEAHDEPLDSLPTSKQYAVPPQPPAPPKTPSSMVNVLYKVDRSEMDRAMAHTGLASAAKVGQLAFDFFLREEVDGDDA